MCIRDRASTVSGELTPQEVAKKVIPSVVCIQNYQRSNNNSMFFFGGGAQSGDAGDEVSPASEGSGIIATSDGYIITNAHVVEGASSLKVILSDGTSYEAQLVGSDSITDLAVIKIDATGLQAAEFGSSGDLEVGDSVMAIGNPGGLELSSSVTQGIVSALNRQITNSETGYTMDCIQTCLLYTSRNCARDRKSLEPAGGAGALEGIRAPGPEAARHGGHRRPDALLSRVRRKAGTRGRLRHLPPVRIFPLLLTRDLIDKHSIKIEKQARSGNKRRNGPAALFGIGMKKSSEGRGLFSGGWNPSRDVSAGRKGRYSSAWASFNSEGKMCIRDRVQTAR